MEDYQSDYQYLVSDLLSRFVIAQKDMLKMIKYEENDDLEFSLNFVARKHSSWLFEYVLWPLHIQNNNI